MATSNKYDRQLRLWGSNGQKALSSCHVLLINASAVGTETLKNLVLPGVGSFHIIDDEIVRAVPKTSNGTYSEISNFFAIPDQCNDLPRSKIACDLLSELNGDVQGSHECVDSLDNVDYKELLKTQLSKKESLLVIAADLNLKPLLSVSNECYCHKINLISVKSYGLIGTLRIQTPYHPVVESKPDHSIPDLRLTEEPLFPLLKAEYEKIGDLDSLPELEHGHTPYVMILLKALEKWRNSDSVTKSSKEQRLPESFKQKEEFKEMIKSMAFNFHTETNFEEAYNEAYLSYTPNELPYEVTEILNAYESSLSSSKPKDYQKDSFGIMIAALHKFLKSHQNQPPLNGTIPDMTSTTESYMALQNAYQTQAKSDFQEMKKLVQSIIDENSISDVDVSDEELLIFCKNIANIRLLKTRSFHDEISAQVKLSEVSSSLQKQDNNEVMEDLKMGLYETKVDTPFLWHIAVRACELFEYEYGTYPGSDSRELSIEADVNTIHKYMKQVIETMGLNDCEVIKTHIVDNSNIAKEIVRYFNAEVHSIASIIGGAGSQEAVKLITHQFFPMDNTFVFNGITCVSGTYKL